MNMWRAHDLKPGFLKPGPRYTQPDWSINNNQVTNRSKLQRAKANQINKDLCCAMGDANTQTRWAIRSTKNHLTHRVEELNLWQSQSAESISLVDEEINTLEQMKAMAERCFQEKAQYRLILGECVTLRDGRMAADLVHDHVEAELKREVDLTEEIKELVQKRIVMLVDQHRNLRDLRTQLAVDHRDKGEAAKLNTQCLSFNLHSSNLGYKYRPCHVAQGTLNYDQWMSHCRGLKQAAERQVLHSSHFRANMQYTLATLVSALDSQRCATDFSLRRRLNELTKAKDSLEWEKQQVQDAVVELVREMQKVETQMLNSGSDQQLAQTRLDILSQRSNHELCIDQPHISLLLENKNLARNTFVLRKNLTLSQQTLESMHRNMMALDEHLATKTRALDIDRKCQDVRQRLLPLRGTAVVRANSSKLQLSPPSSSILDQE